MPIRPDTGKTHPEETLPRAHSIAIGARGISTVVRGSCLILLTACGFDRPQAPSEALPVVQGVLVAGADSQFLRLDWAVSADSSWTGTPDPIAAGDVHLNITGPGGTQALQLRGGGFGVFFVTLPVSADSVYELAGDIAGISISGLTTLPTSLWVSAPAGDTVDLSACDGRCSIPIAVSTVGAAALIVEMRDASGELLFRFVIEPGQDALTFVGYPTVATIDFLALDRNAAGYLVGEELRSSIEGGFGAFGGALRVRKVVKWD